MRNFRNIPIKQKLMVITMATTATALLLAAVGILAFDSFLFRQGLTRDLTALSRIIADNSTAALAFNDPKAANETLAALRARPHVSIACIYQLDGSILAKYSREGATSECPPGGGQDELRFTSAELSVLHPILLNGSRVGSLVMLYDLGELAERMRLYGGTVFGVLLFSSLIAFLLSSNMRAAIATPISHLVHATKSVSETGDYSIRAQKLSGDELGVLVDRFNEMLVGIESRDKHLTTVLGEREEALQDAEKAHGRLRFMAESMPQEIFTTTPSGDVNYCNRQWMEFAGLSFEQIKNWGWSRMLHPDDLDPTLQSWRESLKTGEPFSCLHRFRRADGVYRWHLSRAHAMRDAAGNISMWIGSNTDIHEQKQKEEELRRANEDLQQFVYAASHDLQEPIRNVAVYSEIVAKRYHDVLDPDGQQFLGFLSEGGQRLATLVRDLLAYTRAGVIENSLASAVDSSAVLEQTLLSLAEAIRQSAGKVTYDQLPKVYMTATHLQQLFQNLIGNALKYRTEAPPEIHVSARYWGASWCFAVRDNGMGIDRQYKEKIFGVFKRLHRDQKYSGTGIGLAICQRVVERYGGRIWVESSVGEGATFFFTVPEHAIRTHAAAAESSAG